MVGTVGQEKRKTHRMIENISPRKRGSRTYHDRTACWTTAVTLQASTITSESTRAPSPSLFYSGKCLECVVVQADVCVIFGGGMFCTTTTQQTTIVAHSQQQHQAPLPLFPPVVVGTLKFKPCLCDVPRTSFRRHHVRSYWQAPKVISPRPWPPTRRQSNPAPMP